MTMFSMKPKFDLAQFISDSETGKGAPPKKRYVRQAPRARNTSEDAEDAAGEADGDAAETVRAKARRED